MFIFRGKPQRALSLPKGGPWAVPEPVEGPAEGLRPSIPHQPQPLLHKKGLQPLPQTPFPLQGRGWTENCGNRQFSGQIKVKSTIKGRFFVFYRFAFFPILKLSPFPGEGKGFGVRVEALSYGKRGLGELRGCTITPCKTGFYKAQPWKCIFKIC